MIYILLYLLGFLLSTILGSAMIYREERGTYPGIRSWRESLGIAIMRAGWLSILWPTALPAVYLVTGFAEYGIWSQK